MKSKKDEVIAAPTDVPASAETAARVEAPMLTGVPGERNWGIDLFRMFSMVLVLFLHVLGQGGILNAAGKQEDLTNFYVAWFFEIAAYCAVNCYGLISGYVGVKSKFKYTSVAMLWLQVFFYTALFSILFLNLMPPEASENATFWGKIVGFAKGEAYDPEIVRERVFWNALLPGVKNQYWYFTSYFVMIFFTPAYNYVVNHLPRRKMRAIVIALVVIFSVAPSLFRTELFGTAVSNVYYISGGYNMLWLSVLYVIGAYISKYQCFSSIKVSYCFLVYFLAAGATWLFKFCTEHGAVAVHYTSPTVLLEGVALLLGFSKLRIRPLRHIIKFLSPAAFGVYLVHVHPMIWQHFMLRRYATEELNFAAFPTWKMVLAIFCAVLALYFVCSAIDLIRHYFFKLIHLREGLSFLENKLTRRLWSQDDELS